MPISPHILVATEGASCSTQTSLSASAEILVRRHRVDHHWRAIPPVVVAELASAAMELGGASTLPRCRPRPEASASRAHAAGVRSDLLQSCGRSHTHRPSSPPSSRSLTPLWPSTLVSRPPSCSSSTEPQRPVLRSLTPFCSWYACCHKAHDGQCRWIDSPSASLRPTVVYDMRD
jgi:hypothetical protein